MKQLSTLIILLIYGTITLHAQVSNGRVSSLVAAENYFAAIVKEKGIRNGFLKVSDNKTIVFRPYPVKAAEFYSKKQEDPGTLSWEPTLAKISKSGDWGFTTGPYIYTSAGDSSMFYGQYLSVWKANSRGVWKLGIDLGSPHQKPRNKPELHFTDPKDFKFFRQLSPARLKQREDMIMTTDRLLSATLKKNVSLGYDTFLADEARLLFPGYEPILGKDNIGKFYSGHEFTIETEPVAADRSIGSDLAYTYGRARITRDDQTAEYHYIRIWESQEEFKWNIIVEMFSPAE